MGSSNEAAREKKEKTPTKQHNHIYILNIYYII